MISDRWWVEWCGGVFEKTLEPGGSQLCLFLLRSRSICARNQFIGGCVILGVVRKESLYMIGLVRESGAASCTRLPLIPFLFYYRLSVQKVSKAGTEK